MPENLDGYLNTLNTGDIKKKLQLGQEIVSYVENPLHSLECEDIGHFIDGIVAWLPNSNFKVSQNGLDILTVLVGRMGEDFRPYLSSAFPAVVDRLGDSKDGVREKAQALLMALMKHVMKPQQLFEKIQPNFSHKNGKIREEVLVLLQNTLTMYGSSALTISRLVPSIVKLLSDPMANVRESAMNTMVDVYRHVGERLRQDLNKKHSLPPTKLAEVMKRFDDVVSKGQMMPTATLAIGTVDGAREDETDRATTNGKLGNSTKRSISAPPSRRSGLATPKSSLTSSAVSGRRACKPRTPSATRLPLPSAAGAVDEEFFITAFEDVPKMTLFSGRELDDQLSSLKGLLSDSTKDWDKRVDALKRIRSILIAGAMRFEELWTHLRQLEFPFQNVVKDLRSQVVREACITIAYMAQSLTQKLDHFAESLLPHLINLIPNSAKVISTSGIVCIRFVIAHVYSARLVPILVLQMGSKSPTIRRHACEFLQQLLHAWPTHTLEKHVALLQDAIRRGISDADSEARAHARRAYWGFADHFKDQSNSLLNSLDQSHKRMLTGETGPRSGTSSLPRSRGSSRSGSIENLARISAPRRSPLNTSMHEMDSRSRTNITYPSTTLRSNSAIDLQAAQRAKARAQYAAASRLRIGSGASLHDSARSRKNSESNNGSALASPERSRNRTKVSGVSQSQPGSRSGSPSSRLSYATYASTGESNTMGRPRRKPSSLTSRSTDTSRDTSPTRTQPRSLRSRSLAGQTGARNVSLMAEKILQQSREAEQSFADALHSSPRRRYNTGGGVSVEDHSDDSETSSVCSDRSFDSYRRPSDRLYKEFWDPHKCQDVSEVLTLMGAASWTSRKEGLLGLQSILRSNRMLTAAELHRCMDFLVKMFMDPHVKGTLFLDTLNELITTHKGELVDWLYPLTTKTLNKAGTELLGSVSVRLNKTLDLIRENFPKGAQFNYVMKYLGDGTQTPNTRVKNATLMHLRLLLQSMSSCTPTFADDTIHSIEKIVTWVEEPKSTEVRRNAANVLRSMRDVSPSQFFTVLSHMPERYQQVVKNVLDVPATSINQRSLDSSPKASTPPVMSSPGAAFCSLRLSDENLNPEEVQLNLHKTSAEIQNSFGKLDSISQDSGISTMSGMEERHTSTPDRLLSPLQKLSLNDSFSPRQSKETWKDCVDDATPMSINSVLAELSSPSSRLSGLKSLLKLCQTGHADTIVAEFRPVLRALIEALGDKDTLTKKTGFTALTELVQIPDITPLFANFNELVILRVLDGHKDDDRDVVRAAEQCGTTLAGKMPLELVVRVLKPIIQTGDFPVNQAAVKMLTRVVESQPSDKVMPILADVMPPLIQAYDHSESSVRKAAVFCMVAFHLNVGEASLSPYLESLNGSKLKLLNLYIKRAQTSSNQSSPRLSPGGS